ncbi:MAG TPA: SDR family NAD(P)-dependent oxidoreductase, partial [Candidatus Thermoplasmatota archaeon]|nr:SDR family NAD(P)-dependent oxidoreductase [Candidatus Thermoplasmatota archaeon]
IPDARTEVQNRTLRIVDVGAPKAKPRAAATAPLPATVPIPPVVTAAPATSAKAAAESDGVLRRLVELVAGKTGYPKELLDPDLDMEADLGIDTVKQAELFGAIREAYGLPQEQSIQIKDYDTLRKVAGYVTTRLGGAAPAPSPGSQIPQTTFPTESVKSAPSATPSGASSDEVLPRLIELVASKTGYPKELLDPDLDMEADLGIDTVKQAELFGAIREVYALPVEEGVQVKDYNTMRKVAGYFASRIGGGVAPSAPASSVKPAQPAAPAAAGPGLDAALAEVTRLVAIKTGYPADMLQPDLDMEADLGIDTVKQAELFGEVRSRFAIPAVEGLLIKDYPTLRRVAEFVIEHAGVPAPSTAQHTAPAPVAAVRPAAASILRRIPSLRPVPRPGQGPALQRGAVLAVGDHDKELLDALRQAGFQPTFNLAAGESPAGIVALATKPGATAEARVGPLFDAAKAHRANLGSGRFVLVVTRQDGAHGLASVRDASMAAAAGLAKALKKELPEALVKAVDLHPDAPARLAVDELVGGGTRTEVAYGADATRFVVEVAPQALPDAAPDIAGKGFVVSGGAQGITVETLAALAPQHPRFLLLGRTEVPAEAAEWAKLDAAGWKSLEAQASEALKAKGEKVTPVALRKAVDPKRKAAEVWRNLQRLQAEGAQVLYAPVDVGDAAAVQEAVSWARSVWGRIDGVLHAAGMEVSKDLASKERRQFDQVFAVKAAGWRSLMEATRGDKLDVLAAFGSVAGRFGNLGQTDYSAANEYLAKAVKEEATRRGATTAFTIAWGPWGEVGMATRGSILEIMHASGVTPIPTADGVGHFLREMAAPGVRESVVAGDLGAIDADHQVVAALWDPAAAEAERAILDHPERFRLIEAVEAFEPGRRVLATLHLDQARDAYLRDHRVEGVPYLPGVFGLESFAEAASLLAPARSVLLGAEDVRFASPVKQLKAQPVAARLEARVVENGDGARVACRLTTQFTGPDGKPLGEPRLHFEGTILFGAPPAAERQAKPSEAPLGLRRSDIYPPFFHGPSFQVLASARTSAGGAEALYRPPTEPQFAAGAAEFRSHPMLVEALFQACGLGALAHDKVMALPAALRRLEIFHAGRLPEEVRLVARPTGRDAQGLRTFDAEAVAPDGRLLVRLQGFAMVETGPAPALAVKAGPPASAVSGPDIAGAIVPLPHSDEIHFAAVSIADGPAEEAFFTAAERAQHKAFPAPKRAKEWRAGRLATKKAVLETHPGLRPTDVEVRADEDSGRPRLYIKGEESALWLSLTHRDDLAIAALSVAPLGIDLETVEDRPKSFLEEAFGLAELKTLLASQEPRVEAACMWAAKEAALKRAGTGLRADLRAHEVRADGDGGAVVEGPTGRVGVRFFEVAGKVLAVSAPHLDPKVHASTTGGLR